MSRWCLVLLFTLAAWPASADQQEDARETATAPEATPTRSLTVTRRVHESGRRLAPVALGVGSGYGYTESVLGQQDRHHRLLGALLVEGAPLPWLGVGLRLDGRYDRHQTGTQPVDDGWIGEPRLHVQADRALTATLSAGLRGTLFLPGADAPSWSPGATSADLLALITHGGQAVKLSGNAGYRLDRSARSVMDASQYMPGDRLALGVSEFDAVLLGAGASYDFGGWQLFGDWSWEMLVGSGAPAAARWPMRLGAGGRAALTRAVDVELLVETSPSGRPPVEPSGPLVPVPPRLAVMAGLVVPLGGRAPAPPAEVTAPAPVAPPPAEVPSLAVTLTAMGGLPAGTSVVLERGSDRRPLTDEGDGRFGLRGLPPGPATVVVNAPDHEESRTAIQLAAGQPATLAIALQRKLPSGQIRGTVRSFLGRGITATVRVTPTEGSLPTPDELRSDGGSFQVDVPPGRYQVIIQAPGHAPQTRTVLVEKNGVTVLNVDLRPGR